ncbi:hypothetical protein Q8F55_001177 [Vanrija albida]|uniref:BolA protein n=1 Tax=Vanrija albida TaxID=181172 RepID=A0ABR3QFC0_9TREE
MAEPIDRRIEAKLRASIAIEHLEITDTSANCGSSFALVIVSPDFARKMTLARHKLVNQILADEITQLHAFSQKTLTPEQWAKERGA